MYTCEGMVPKKWSESLFVDLIINSGGKYPVEEQVLVVNIRKVFPCVEFGHTTERLTVKGIREYKMVLDIGRLNKYQIFPSDVSLLYPNNRVKE